MAVKFIRLNEHIRKLTKRSAKSACVCMEISQQESLRQECVKSHPRRLGNIKLILYLRRLQQKVVVSLYFHMGLFYFSVCLSSLTWMTWWYLFYVHPAMSLSQKRPVSELHRTLRAKVLLVDRQTKHMCLINTVKMMKKKRKKSIL